MVETNRLEMKVIITGTSGMVGRGVLLECLYHPKIDKILSIGRTNIDLDHPKLIQLEHKDFSEFTTQTENLKDYDACYMCMGVSAAGLSAARYTEITYDYTLTLAEQLIKLNDQMTITYVSGEGTDSSEKGRTMWARVKGKTENDLMALGLKQAFMFRPGAIIPLRGIKSRTKLYQFVYDYFMWLVRLMKWLAPNSVVNTTQVGLAMINATRNGNDKQVIRPKDIIKLAEG